MSLDRIRGRIASAPFFSEFRSAVRGLPSGAALRVRGAVGSLPAFVVLDAALEKRSLVVAVLPTDESAAYLQSDLEQISDEKTEILAFPAGGTSMRRAEIVTTSDCLMRNPG